jgi:DNA-binding NarL/FixJ family response regulator
MKKVIIADDHVAVRMGLEMLLRDGAGEPCLIEHASNGNQVLHKVQAAEYDMLVMDMNMPGVNGLQLLEKSLELQPSLRILVISVNPEDFFATKCLQSGAMGFISKKADDDELKKALRNVTNGKVYVSENQRNKIARNYFREDSLTNPFQSLSSRELDVTLLLLKGMGVLEVANALDVSQSTASTFKGRIFKKLDVASLLELNQLARRFGLTDDNSALH